MENELRKMQKDSQVLWNKHLESRKLTSSDDGSTYSRPILGNVSYISIFNTLSSNYRFLMNIIDSEQILKNVDEINQEKYSSKYFEEIVNSIKWSDYNYVEFFDIWDLKKHIMYLVLKKLLRMQGKYQIVSNTTVGNLENIFK